MGASMVTVASTQDERELHTQCLLNNAATRAENAALRQALQVNAAAVNSLFERLLEAESEYPWLTDALRRSEQRCSDLETQVVELNEELDALRRSERHDADLEKKLAGLGGDVDHLRSELDRIYETKTFRLLAPVRRVWSVMLRASGPAR
jgi:predicted nuclease with TOPRIM domain